MLCQQSTVNFLKRLFVVFFDILGHAVCSYLKTTIRLKIKNFRFVCLLIRWSFKSTKARIWKSIIRLFDRPFLEIYLIANKIIYEILDDILWTWTQGHLFHDIPHIFLNSFTFPLGSIGTSKTKKRYDYLFWNEWWR